MSRRAWLSLLAALLGSAAVALLLNHWLQRGPRPPAAAAEQVSRFAPERPLTLAAVASLRWEEIDQLLAAHGGDDQHRSQLDALAAEAGTPPATYARALLLIVEREPEQALAAFGSLDPQALPAAMLYAPFRLWQALRPDAANPYLPPLRRAVAQREVAPLIRARVLAFDGDLLGALENYLRSDPAGWTRYDLQALRQIATHQGLAPDRARLIAGAVSSGGLERELAAELRRIPAQRTGGVELEAFRERIERAVREQTAEGKLVIASARKLLQDRQQFLARDYSALLDANRDTVPLTLPNETLLLLFLSAVQVQDALEMERWGQELKRRHTRQSEVGAWVDEMTAGAQ